MPLSALYAAVLACLQHLRASLVPSITCGNRTSRNPGGAERAAGTSSFGPRPLRPQRHAIAHAHATETISSDGTRGESIRACAGAAGNQSCKRGLIERTARAGAIACCGRAHVSNPKAPNSKVANPKVPNPAPRHHRVRLGTVVRRPLGAIRLALRCRHLCRDLAADDARGRCNEWTADQSSFIRLSTSRPSRP